MGRWFNGFLLAIVLLAIGSILAQIPLRLPSNATQEQILGALRQRVLRLEVRRKVARAGAVVMTLALFVGSAFDMPAAVLRGLIVTVVVCAFAWAILRFATLRVLTEIQNIMDPIA